MDGHASRDRLDTDDIEEAYTEFIPSAQGLSKEMQVLAAVVECTQYGFLPESWRKRLKKSDGQAKLRERLVALRQLLGE